MHGSFSSRPVLGVKNALCLIGWLLCLNIASGAWASDRDIYVVYPKVTRPYSAILEQIVDGIESNSKGKTTSFVLDENDNDFKGWLGNNKPKVIVALGNQSFTSLKKAQYRSSVIIAAVLMPPENFEQDIPEAIAVSYAPSPELLFSHLKNLSPDTKQVSAVYNPETTQWLIDEALIAAGQYNLKLNLYKADSFTESAKQFKTATSSLSGNKDAIWLLQDNSILNDKDILPPILTAAWEKQFIVFSSNLAHVKKGALFSLYPDNNKLGKRLADIAKSLSKDGGAEPQKTQSLKDANIAVNIRTASNIGLKISNRQKQGFGLIFPKSARRGK